MIKRRLISFMSLFFLCVALNLTVSTTYALKPIIGEISVSNSSKLHLHEKLLSLDWKLFSAKLGIADTSGFKIESNGKELPVQFEYLGGQNVVNILVLVDIPPYSIKKLQVVKGQRAYVKARTYGRFVKERKDDFAWENDRVGFRMYGKALELTNENAHGIDVWVKRTKELVLNDRYRRNDYHEDHGDGLDYYSVGSTLGAGNLAPFWNDSIWYPGNYSRWEMLDNGPLRTSFRLYYEKVTLNNMVFSMVKTIQLDAGTYLNKITVDLFTEEKNDIPIAIGIVKRKESGVFRVNEKKGIMNYWEPAHPKYGTTGVAVITSGNYRYRMGQNQFLLTTEAKAGQSITYYAGACWDKEGVIVDPAQWEKWTEDEQIQLEALVKLNINFYSTLKKTL